MLTYDEFIKAHPELWDKSSDEKLDAYDLYVSTAGERMSSDDWVLG